MKITYLWAALLSVALLLCACTRSEETITSQIADSAPSFQAIEPGADVLPALEELNRMPAEAGEKLGSSLSMGRHVTIEDSSARLEYNNFTVPGTERRDYSYAVYIFSNLSSLPPILAIETHGSNTSRVYPAVANWRTGRWDFGSGHVYTYATHSLPLPELEEQPGDFISADGRLAVAFLKVDVDGPSWIDNLYFWEPQEVIGVFASEGLWDGIDISWEVPGGTDFVNIERRAQGIPSWETVLEEPVPANLLSYKDSTAEGGTYYEYRVSGGYRWDTVFGPQYFWTTGKKAIGLRSVDTVALGMNEEEYLVPGNSFNRLSYFFAPTNDANGVHAVRNNSFPPGTDWDLFDETSTNFPYINVAFHPELGPGITVFQLNELNNPLVNITYSDGTGVYSYCALLDQEGHFEWLNPGEVRDAGNHVLGIMELERRLACFTWNSFTQRVEMVESVDNEGTYWWEYNPNNTFAVVTERRPMGAIDISQTMRQAIAFREKGSNAVVVCRKASDGWQEETVGIETSARPILQNIKINQLDNSASVFYRDMEGERIRLIRNTAASGWLTNQQETIVNVGEGEQIDEFVHYMLDPPSNFNILAYVHDGNLKFRFSSKTGQDVWSEEFVVDDSGSCRNISITRIGTDLQWKYFTFLSFIRNDVNGDAQLKFVDLNSLLEAEGML